MIDKPTFHAGMAVLAGCYGREVTPALIRIYYEALAHDLTNDAFERAVQCVVKTETFWPAPAVILRAAGQDSEAEAVSALRHVNRVIGAYGGVPFVPRAAWLEFDHRTREAIRVCGGLAEIASVTTERYPALQRRFIRIFASLPKDPLLAPAATPPAPTDIDPRVRAIVADVSRVRSA